MEVFILIQPLCEQTLQIYTSENTCEKVCRLYKYSMRSIGKTFGNYLPTFCDHLLTAFTNQQYSPFIYAASICVSEFGASNGLYDELLYRMLWGISQIFFQKYQSLVDFENAPDVVEEYFHLLARYLDNCPTQLISSPQLGVLIEAGLTGLQLHHREATKGILHFIEKFIAATHLVSDTFKKAIEKMVVDMAPRLLLILFKSLLLGELPSYVLHESSGSLCDVVWKMKQTFPNQLTVHTVGYLVYIY